MKPAHDAPTRPALRYYGGGWMRARWTLEHVPAAHDTWVDLCFGAGSVTALKSPAPLEIANDINGRVVNFMKQLRDNAPALVQKINLTPWAEDEMRACLETAVGPLEDARRFFAVCWMTIHGGPHGGRTSFRFQKSVEGRYTPPALDAVGRDDLLEFAARLKSVHFFNRDAIELIVKFGDNPQAALYFDPPYLQETRERKRGYTHEVSAAWHRLAAYHLRQATGYVIVAGYPSRLYERIYEDYGWQRVERRQRTNGKTVATECLWLSPRTVEQLVVEKSHMALPLFAQIDP